MRMYLKPVPFAKDAPPRAVTVVSPEARDVVYLDQSASIELITEALKAWGLRVRAERQTAAGRKSAPPAAGPGGSSWETTRPEGRAPARLDNILSPLWLPIREEVAGSGSEAPADWSWFGRAA